MADLGFCWTELADAIGVHRGFAAEIAKGVASGNQSVSVSSFWPKSAELANGERAFDSSGVRSILLDRATLLTYEPQWDRKPALVNTDPAVRLRY